jgi:hypothetical protein
MDRPINFHKAVEDNDQEAMDNILKLLEEETRKRNTMSVDEFRQFEPLFHRNAMETLGVDNYRELCSEYASRISIYHPVHIIDHNGNEIKTLPAIFHQTNAISDIGIGGNQLVDAFTNAHTNSDDFDIKKKTYTKHMIHAIGAAQDLDRKNDSMRMNQALYSKAVEDRVDNDDAIDVKAFVPEEVSELDTGLSNEVEYL